MSRGGLVATAVALALAGAAGMAWMTRPSANPVERPPLALLTSLPLLFGEQFGIAPPRSPAIERLRREFTIVPIAVADRTSLTGQRRLLMAHPRAQPAEVLVELDQWVRRGGQVVLLADPRLRWQGSRPLGDPLSPPPDFADTGLLDHWGLALDTDAAGEGVLRALDARCQAARGGLIARCRIGTGRASVIADADFMMGEGQVDAQRLDLVIAEIKRPFRR